MSIKARVSCPRRSRGRGWPALIIGLALLAGLGAARQAPAQGLNPLGAGSGQPINITADSGIEWQQDKQIYVARGNAAAIRGSSEVHADVLTAHYRPSKDKSAEGGNEVYRLEAAGHVVIKAPNRTVVGDQALYDVDQQIGIVTGQHLRLTTPTDVVTARDSLEWYDQQQVAVARGDAIAIRGDRRIRADILTAHFIKDAATVRPIATASGEVRRAGARAGQPKTAPTAAVGSAQATAKTASGKPGATGASLDPNEGNTKISRIDAQGHVLVATATDVGRGDYGVYNAQTGIVTLLGNVTLTRGQDAVKGEYAVVDLNTNISRIMAPAGKPGGPGARVEGLFYRQDATSPPAATDKSRPKSGSSGTVPKS